MIVLVLDPAETNDNVWPTRQMNNSNIDIKVNVQQHYLFIINQIAALPHWT